MAILFNGATVRFSGINAGPFSPGILTQVVHRKSFLSCFTRRGLQKRFLGQKKGEDVKWDAVDCAYNRRLIN